MSNILTEIGTPENFGESLKQNPGYVIIKFGATWCTPCKRIKDQVHELMEKLDAEKYLCYDIDIDDFFELYAHFKSKKILNAIPTILAWKKGNINIVPDFIVSSSKADEVNYFFSQLI